MLSRLSVLVALLASLVAVIGLQPPTALADLGCSSIVDGSQKCNGWPDSGGDVYWGQAFSASSIHNAYMYRTLRSWGLTGTGDNMKYGVYGMEVEVQPDLNNMVSIWWYNQADQSANGDNATINTKLWDTQTRYSCGSTICDQRNFNGLELQGEHCDPNGQSQSLSFTGNAGVLSVSLSLSQPLYHGCYEVPASDLYSQYYDYTLMQSNLGSTKVVQTFTFSQVKPYDWLGSKSNINHHFNVGLSAKAIFITGFSKFTVSSGNWYDDWNY